MASPTCYLIFMGKRLIPLPLSSIFYWVAFDFMKSYNYNEYTVDINRLENRHIFLLQLQKKRQHLLIVELIVTNVVSGEGACLVPALS